MKKHLFLLLLTFTVLFCAQAQSLGAGVSIDAQGSLKINAPLYILDKNPQKPGIKRAPTSLNLPVVAGFHIGDDFGQLEVTGGIVKGRISLIIKKPDEVFLVTAASLLNIPSVRFTSGADVKVGDMSFYADDSEYNYRIMLFSNFHVEGPLPTYDYEQYDINGVLYKYIYSLGEVIISGNVDKNYGVKETSYRKFDIRLKNGWNVTKYNPDKPDDTLTSSLPPSNAVWVLFEI